MKWRCEWCGKPHESDDPPCDNCGHGTFEEAVVQQATAGDSTTVWLCPDCGREHPRNSPPCSRCGNPTLERKERVITEENLTDRPGSADAGSPDSDSTTVWLCPDCGREHPRNSPPCSRCGHPTLERERKTVSDDELTTPGYLDLITPKYAAVLGAVVLVAVAFGLGATGVVDLPFFPDDGVPEVDGVPGNDSEVNGLSLAAVEDAYLDRLDDRRAGPALERSSYLDEVATFYNQRRVRWLAGDGTLPSNEKLGDLLREECSAAASLGRASLTIEDGAGPAEIGAQFANAVTETSEGTTIGLDVHSVGDELFLAQFTCRR